MYFTDTSAQCVSHVTGCLKIMHDVAGHMFQLKSKTVMLNPRPARSRWYFIKYTSSLRRHYTRVCPKVSGLVAWSENCKWYSSLPLGAVVSLFC